MVKLTFDEERVPLRETHGGTVYVGNTKVALEGIVFAHKRGRTPEQIQWAFDAVSLGDVYLVIGYYLHRPEEVEEYLAEYERSWDRFVEETLAQPGAKEFYDRLELTRRQKTDGQVGAGE
jgi:uncharacterized protein (DUF433 family)